MDGLRFCVLSLPNAPLNLAPCRRIGPILVRLFVRSAAPSLTPSSSPPWCPGPWQSQAALHRNPSHRYFPSEPINNRPVSWRAHGRRIRISRSWGSGDTERELDTDQEKKPLKTKMTHSRFFSHPLRSLPWYSVRVIPMRPKLYLIPWINGTVRPAALKETRKKQGVNIVEKLLNVFYLSPNAQCLQDSLSAVFLRMRKITEKRAN